MSQTPKPEQLTQLFLVIPVYNEQDCIKKVLIDWMNTLQSLKCSRTLVVVNDGSTDQTGRILENFAKEQKNNEIKLEILNIRNGGHGPAIMKGYLRAIELSSLDPGSFIFQVDSDDQFESQDIFKLLEFAPKFDFIFGQRLQRNDPLNRILISKILKFIVFIFFAVNAKDSNIPFRLMRATALRDILNLMSNGLFAPNIFITTLALTKWGHSTKQGIAVKHKARKTGKVSIMNLKLLKVCFKSFKQLLSFKYLNHE